MTTTTVGGAFTSPGGGTSTGGSLANTGADWTLAIASGGALTAAALGARQLLRTRNAD